MVLRSASCSNGERVELWKDDRGNGFRVVVIEPDGMPGIVLALKTHFDANNEFVATVRSCENRAQGGKDSR
jgi:hypothetical protein